MPPLILSLFYVVAVGTLILLESNGLDLLAASFALIMAAGFGVARVVTRHPAFQLDYYAWLTSTPWKLGKPLPLGPVYGELWDLPVLIFGTLLAAAISPLFAAGIVVAYVVGYCSIAALAAWWLGQRSFTYLVVFLFGLAILFWSQPWMLIVILAGCLSVAKWGLQATLRGFPWGGVKDSDIGDLRLGAVGLSTVVTVHDANTEPARAGKVGWPWNRLARWSPQPILTPTDAALIGFLAGWFFFALAQSASAIDDAIEEDAAGAAAFAFLLILIGALGRASVYVYTCRPPISILGRLVTKRIIVPDYDRCLAGPAAAVAVVALGSVVHHPYWLTALMFGLAAAILAGAPPALRVWQLTGRHRSPEPDTQTKNTLLIGIK
jgi:hypothetical protein